MAVSIWRPATRCKTMKSGSIPGRSPVLLGFQNHSDRILRRPTLLFSGKREVFPQGKAVEEWR
jgi:hypothetical protein